MVFHLGMAGSLPIMGRALDTPITYQVKLSYSHNLGTYDIPYKPARNQFSGYFGLATPLSILGGLQVMGSVAVDAGTLYPNSIGTFLSIRKAWRSSPAK